MRDIIIAAIIMIILVIILSISISKQIDYVDTHGGLKSIVNRAWEGAK